MVVVLSPLRTEGSVVQQLDSILAFNLSLESRLGVKGVSSLVSFADYRERVMKDFETRDLYFSLKYEAVTSKAVEVIDMEYLHEVVLMGREELFNKGDWGIYSEEDILPLTSSTSEGILPDLTQEDIQIDVDLLRKAEVATLVGFSEEGGTNSPTPSVDYDLDSFDLDGFLGDISPMMTGTGNNVSSPNSKEEVESGTKTFDGSLSARKEEVNVEVQSLSPTDVEDKPVPKSNVIYYQGMSLREFLRENPRTTMALAEEYYAKKEIMKNIQLGKIIKRGDKLFI